MSSDRPDRQSPAQGFQMQRRFCRACALQMLYQLDLGEDWEPGDREFEQFWEQLADNGEIPPFRVRPTALRKDFRRLVELVLGNRTELDAALSGVSAKQRMGKGLAMETCHFFPSQYRRPPVVCVLIQTRPFDVVASMLIPPSERRSLTQFSPSCR